MKAPVRTPLESHLMLPADDLSASVVYAKPVGDHRGVGHRAADRKVLALVHIVFMSAQFSGIRCGRLELARWGPRTLLRSTWMMIWRRGRRWLVIVALIALARRYGLHNQHWNGVERRRRLVMRLEEEDEYYYYWSKSPSSVISVAEGEARRRSWVVNKNVQCWWTWFVVVVNLIKRSSSGLYRSIYSHSAIGTIP